MRAKQKSKNLKRRLIRKAKIVETVEEMKSEALLLETSKLQINILNKANVPFSYKD